MADVSERYLNDLEHGDANISIRILERIAHALGAEIADLLPPSRARSTPGSQTAIHQPLASLIAAMSLREQTDAVAVLTRHLHDRRKSQRGIALLGLRGAGKSTIGGLFATHHDLPFVSVTREIEARAGMSLNDLFNLGGPDAYRTLENDVVSAIAERDDRIVLETAGGIVSNTPALEMILASFKTIWLRASPDEHLQRVIQQGDMRPMHGTPKALEHLKSLLAAREEEYGRADYMVDTTGKSPDDCVAELNAIATAAELG